MITFLLLVVTVVLIVSHFILDAGPDKEAPDWILLVSMATAVACTLIGSLSRPSQ